MLTQWAQLHKAWDEEGKSVTNTEALEAYNTKEPLKPLLSTYKDVDD